MDLPAAVAESRRAGLIAIRDHLAACLEDAQSDKAAPLAKQLAETMRELESLAEPRGSAVDALAAKRAARRQASA